MENVAPAPVPESCGKFETLKSAILLPMASYNTREKSMAISECSRVCGIVHKKCCDFANADRWLSPDGGTGISLWKGA